MTIEQLNYFVKIARYQSITAAANELHISQPSLSQAIAKLENELGTKLFKRSRNGVQLTENGELILNKAQSILRLVEEIKNEADMNRFSFNGKFSVGIIPSICVTFLPDTLSIFKKEFPGVDLDIKETGSLDIVNKVKQGELDLGLIAIKTNSWTEEEDIVFNKLFNFEIMAWVSKNMALYNETISPEELIKYPIVLFNSHYSVNGIIKDFLKPYGEMKLLFNSDNTESFKQVIKKGLAIGFYPDFVLNSQSFEKPNDIIPLRIENFQSDMTVGWVYHKKFSLSDISKEFIKVLKSQINFIN